MTNKYFFRILAVITSIFLMVSCGGGEGPSLPDSDQLVVKQISHNIAIPSNITLAFKVEKSNGEPVSGLQTGDLNADGTENLNFEIWENNYKISQDEATARINPDSGDFEYFVFILLDLSASILNSGLEETKAGVSSLIESLFSKGFQNESLNIKLGFFDGSSTIQVIQAFTNDKTLLLQKIDDITSDISHDPSTNLYGATIQGIEELNNTIQDSENSEEKFIVAGSLVLFTDGTDQAARNTFTQAKEAISNAHQNAKIFTIGLGNEIDESVLKTIGRDGYKKAEEAEDLSDTFVELADLITQETESYYVLRYCSPKRGGTSNSLKLIVKKDGLQGETSLNFNAEDFVSGCVIE